ncbi:MAG TPA: hypothetical protein VGR15_02240 [Bacteroidota bacterium]|nr:hypothetical protein [Bacteroidota bacterium]
MQSRTILLVSNEEYYFRRWGLGVSTLIISLVAVSLYLAIRRIERKQSAKTSARNAGSTGA